MITDRWSTLFWAGIAFATFWGLFMIALAVWE